MINKKTALLTFVTIPLLTAGAIVLYRAEARPASLDAKFRTEQVDRGDITQVVTATGTINPVALINVGSQVSGTVTKLNADFNDRVKKGQILLELDPTIFNAQVRQSRANLLAQQASLNLARANLQRNERLVAENYVSPLTLDQLRHEFEVAQANVSLAEAQLARNKADLDNSVIRSPINGVVIKRTIDLGQTVAASFNTPNLFQIANDLTKMQIDTNVSEADVAMLREGGSARFIVDAYPTREFEAKLRQFRLAATVVQNIVTYNAVLDVANKDELLKPGMTAQVRFIVGMRPDVLRIPTAALRFRLTDDAVKNQQQAAPVRNKVASGNGSLPSGNEKDDVSFRSNDAGTRIFKIYKLTERNGVTPVDIQIGLSNFKYTEVVAGDLHPGERVVTRLRTMPKTE